MPNVTVLAPLAGITNLPYRLIVKSAGCALVCSEMISANGLVYDSEKTFRLLDSAPEERPLSVQIFGSDPAKMRDAAVMVESAGADILDINFGCSVKKIVKQGAGVALMKEPRKTGEILDAVRKSIQIPLTIKIRSGWDFSGDQAMEIARIAQDAGVEAIAVHPRTARQGFSGKADWPLITKIKTELSIPIIGNGDINTPEDAAAMLQQTGCDAVMIGRAAIGYPWIFSQTVSFLRGEGYTEPDVADRFDAMKHYIRASVDYLGEKTAMYMMRSRLAWFSKGLPHSARFRESIKQIASEADAFRLIESYQAYLIANPL